MSDSNLTSRALLNWFKNSVFQRTEPAPVLEELDKLAAQVEALDIPQNQLFPICLLGQAGVGKSTLINTLVADSNIVVPSGGGTGPLTANALRVLHGERPSFIVRYHASKALNQTRAILDFAIYRQTKDAAAKPVIDPEDGPEISSFDLDDDKQSNSRMEEAIGQAKLLIAGQQKADRSLTYLADALRHTLGQKLKYQSHILPDDVERIQKIQEALKHATQQTARHFDSEKKPDFRHHLRDHACGFLAPLISEMSIYWPSPLLKDSLELVDLPGIGIWKDAYEAVTKNYLQNKAKAVMLVTTDRGIRKEDAEFLYKCGFLTRFLHSSDDLAADPVVLMVAVVKIDDVAKENWKNDRELNGQALKSKAQHFDDLVKNCRDGITNDLNKYLREVWNEDSEKNEVKEEVIQSIISTLQVFPVSAPQYRMFIDPDDDKPFLPDVASTNIPALRQAISQVAQRCLEEQKRRAEDVKKRFFGQLRARLAVLSAQKREPRPRLLNSKNRWMPS